MLSVDYDKSLKGWTRFYDDKHGLIARNEGIVGILLIFRGPPPDKIDKGAVTNCLFTNRLPISVIVRQEDRLSQ